MKMIPTRRWPIDALEGPVPFCNCFAMHPRYIPPCLCGEDYDTKEWNWEIPLDVTNWVHMGRNNRQVVFHPYYSSGTAVIKGDASFERDMIYYWEVKMMSEPYGTDVMVGVGTDKVDLFDSVFHFRSFLGRDEESYGLSYTGAVSHGGCVTHDSPGFGRGSIVGVKVDMWRGTLEFFLNREGLGISYTNLRKHSTLYPMICATAAQSVMHLIYASSWKASLFVNACKILGNSVHRQAYFEMLPPVMRAFLKEQFFLTLPSQSADQIHKMARLLRRQALIVTRRHWHRMW